MVIKINFKNGKKGTIWYTHNTFPGNCGYSILRDIVFKLPRMADSSKKAVLKVALSKMVANTRRIVITDKHKDKYLSKLIEDEKNKAIGFMLSTGFNLSPPVLGNHTVEGRYDQYYTTMGWLDYNERILTKKEREYIDKYIDSINPATGFF